jgi:exosome complex RNA-binding protein Rrp4
VVPGETLKEESVEVGEGIFLKSKNIIFSSSFNCGTSFKTDQT